MSNNIQFRRNHACLLSAVTEVASACVVWRRAEGGEKINIFQLENMAREIDQEQPLKEGDGFYTVSPEGAIGFCPGGIEYLTRWLFYPSMDEASVTEFVTDMYRKLEEIKAEEDAAVAATAAAAPQPAQPAAEAPVARFCPNCGLPYPDDETRFCPNCGTPRQ